MMDRQAQTANPSELISTKLSLPRLSFPRVKRPALVERLNSGLLRAGGARKLTLLSAPAGYGKTTLAVEWIHRLRERAGGTQAAWVSLDSGDNDPARFWRYVFSAIGAFDPAAGSAALRRLQASQTPPYEAAITALVNDLAQRPGRELLVLEDYHCIANPQIHADIAFLIDYLPPRLHLALLTRGDPPLPLARLRARDEVNELRAPDLRFSEAEAVEFLASALSQGFLRQPGNPGPPALLPETAARLAERTEGWPAGLRLTALALRSRRSQDEQEQFLDTFTGSHGPVLEYLAADVLALQEESIQEFLLETSLLGRLTGSLCEAVTGRQDSAGILERLVRANLFLEPLDGAGAWYRYHVLFAEAMQFAARRRLGESRLRQIAQAASLWYEAHALQNGAPSSETAPLSQQAAFCEAVEAALFAQSFERAAELIERIVEPRLVGNEYHTLLRWIQALPENILRAHPTLCMAYAQAILFTSERNTPGLAERMQKPLELAEAAWTAEGNEPRLGEVLALRALLAVRQGDYAASFRLARQALRRLPDGAASQNGLTQTETEWRAVSLNLTGWEAYYSGRLNDALPALGAARGLFQSVGNVFGILDATLALGEVHTRRAEPQQAAAFYRQALDEAEGAPISRKDRLRRQGGALAGLAALACERDDLEAAGRDAAAAAAIAQEIDSDEILADASIVLARVQRAQGEIEPARKRLNTVAARIKRPLALAEIETWQAWLALAAGDLAAGQRWSAAHPGSGEDIPVLLREREALVLARLYLAEGKPGQALPLLESWRVEAHLHGRTRSELDICILAARAHAACCDLAQARQELVQALALAQPGDFRRVFLEEGEPLAGMLGEAMSAAGEEPIAGRAKALLAVQEGEREDRRTFNAAAPAAVPDIELLSLQEERVLRLLGAGLSNPEIAHELVVSVNTVKTHIKGIYRKLGVNNRRMARAAARHLERLSF